ERIPVSPPEVAVTGIGVSPGRVAGPAVRMAEPLRVPPSGRRLLPGADPAPEAARIYAAAQQVRADLAAVAARVSGTAREMLDATAEMAADPTLLADAAERVTTAHLVAERAVWEAAEVVASEFAAIGGPLADRVRDVIDVRDRLVAALKGRPAPGVPQRAEPFVLVA